MNGPVDRAVFFSDLLGVPADIAPRSPAKLSNPFCLIWMMRLRLMRHAVVVSALLALAQPLGAVACETLITGRADSPLSVIRISGSPAVWRNPCHDLPASLVARLGSRHEGKLTITGYAVVAGSTSMELAETSKLMAEVMHWLLQQGVPRERVTFGSYVLVMDRDDPGYVAEEGSNWVELSVSP